MSLRVRAGGAPARGQLHVASSTAPRSTWPFQPMPLPPSSRGKLLLAKAAAYTPLTVRDRGQLAQLATHAAPAPRRQSAAIETAARQHNFRPVRADRGWRRPYTIPRPPGGGAAPDGTSSSPSSPSGAGCCGK